MSLILAQQIILLITDKNRGCSSELLSHAQGGTHQENITLESQLENMADHTRAAAAMTQEVTLFKIRAAGLVSDHWEMVITGPINTLHGTGPGNGPQAAGGASALGVTTHMASAGQLQSILCVRVPGNTQHKDITVLCPPGQECHHIFILGTLFPWE